MSRGDAVRVLIDTGNGTSREFLFEARLNGRKFETSTSKGQLVIEEQVPSGRVVRSATFQQARILACIEEPTETVEEPEKADEVPRLFEGGS